MTEPFNGAKIAILVGDRIITILRDDDPAIAFPNLWDLPGGGREGAETGEETVLRELNEELGIKLPAGALRWSLLEPVHETKVWFYAAEWPEFEPALVRFGDEGQEWRLVSIDWFLSEVRVVPNLQRRLRLFLEKRDTLRT